METGSVLLRQLDLDVDYGVYMELKPAEMLLTEKHACGVIQSNLVAIFFFFCFSKLMHISQMHEKQCAVLNNHFLILSQK